MFTSIDFGQVEFQWNSPSAFNSESSEYSAQIDFANGSSTFESASNTLNTNLVAPVASSLPLA